VESKYILLVTIVVIVFASIIFFTSEEHENLIVVDDVDLQLYSGDWYSVYELPVYYGFYPFGYDSTECGNPKANYTLNDDGTIKVVNSCDRQGERIIVEGKARSKDPDNINGEFYVSFYLFESDYNILGIGDSYQWAVVGTLDRDGLWFLSRNNTLSFNDYIDMLSISDMNGYDIGNLVETKKV